MDGMMHQPCLHCGHQKVNHKFGQYGCRYCDCTRFGDEDHCVVCDVKKSMHSVVSPSHTFETSRTKGELTDCRECGHAPEHHKANRAGNGVVSEPCDVRKCKCKVYFPTEIVKPMETCVVCDWPEDNAWHDEAHWNYHPFIGKWNFEHGYTIYNLNDVRKMKQDQWTPDDTIRSVLRWSANSPQEAREFINAFEDTRETTKQNDAVNHPSHYTRGKIEVWDFIVDLRGNAVKYITQAGEKDPDLEEQDIDKAIAYLKREKKSIQDKKKEKTDGLERSGSIADVAGTSDVWRSVGFVPLDGPSSEQAIQGDD